MVVLGRGTLSREVRSELQNLVGGMGCAELMLEAKGKVFCDHLETSPFISRGGLNIPLLGHPCVTEERGRMSTVVRNAKAPERAGLPAGRTIRSLIPARLDRLGWSRFHTMLVVALGVAWVLDGLEITIASNVTGLISNKAALNLSSSEVAFAVGTVYLLGEVAGALFFGRLSDKWGRRNLFMITLGVYLFGGL